MTFQPQRIYRLNSKTLSTKMSTDTGVNGPIEFLAHSLILLIVYIAFFGLISIITLSSLYGLGSVQGNFGVLAIFGLAFLSSQLELVSESSQDFSELGRMKRWIIYLVGFIVYSAIIAFAGIVATITYSIGYPNFAYLVALVWPLWELETANWRLPVSYLGLATFIGWIAVKTGLFTKETFSLIQENLDSPLRWLEFLVIDRFGVGSIRV